MPTPQADLCCGRFITYMICAKCYKMTVALKRPSAILQNMSPPKSKLERGRSSHPALIEIVGSFDIQWSNSYVMHLYDRTHCDDSA